MRMTLKILRMFLARPAGGRYVTAFQHPSPRWLSALSRFAKSQALHLGDHSLGAGSSSAAFSSSYSCRGRHHCMLRVPGNSIFLPQDSADLSADQSQTELRVALSLCAGVRASFPKAPTQPRQAGPQPHKTPRASSQPKQNEFTHLSPCAQQPATVPGCQHPMSAPA